MVSPTPIAPKIYHILHVDRLASIVADEWLWCDAEVVRRSPPGTTIGMNTIKQRRLTNAIGCHPGLHVGDCVPFYFCSRSIMLYLLHMANHPDLDYRGGQGAIIHLEADLHETITWAEQNNLRWAFTLSNAGAYYFEDDCDIDQLDRIDWAAVNATQWGQHKEGKQAEFLLDRQFPWHLVSRIGVFSQAVHQQVTAVLNNVNHRPAVEVIPSWYY